MVLVTRLCFLDIETTGLDPDRHEVYEIALIRGDTSVIENQPTELHLWISDAPLATADPTALRIGRYYERWPYSKQYDQTLRLPMAPPNPSMDPWLSELPSPYIIDGKTAAWIVAAATAGAHLVGAVPSFDAAFLDRLLRRHNLVPAWHYHLVDVEALAAGALAYLAASALACSGEERDAKAVPPWDSSELSRAVGVEPDKVERHTALGDARWAKAIYDAVMEPAS
jgi:hypothetical protein